jgi:hypothetical protein
MPNNKPLLILTLLINFTLMGCQAMPTNNEVVIPSSPPKIDIATFTRLQKHSLTYLDDLKSKQYQKKQKFIISTAPYIKATVLAYEKISPTPHTLNNQQLSLCDFIASRIELDNQIKTAEWLITTTGQGHCEVTAGRDQPKTYWLMMHTPKQLPTILIANRAHNFSLRKREKGDILRRFKTNKGDMIEGTDIECSSYFLNKGQGYQVYKQTTEAYVHTVLIPSKTWQPTHHPKHICRP